MNTVSIPPRGRKSRRAARTSQCILSILRFIKKLLFYCSGIRAIVYTILLASIEHIPSRLSDFIFCAEIIFRAMSCLNSRITSTSLFDCVTVIAARTQQQHSIRVSDSSLVTTCEEWRESKLKSIVLASSYSVSIEFAYNGVSVFCSVCDRVTRICHVF